MRTIRNHPVLFVVCQDWIHLTKSKVDIYIFILLLLLLLSKHHIKTTSITMLGMNFHIAYKRRVRLSSLYCYWCIRVKFDLELLWNFTCSTSKYLHILWVNVMRRDVAMDSPSLMTQFRLRSSYQTLLKISAVLFAFIGCLSLCMSCCLTYFK